VTPNTGMFSHLRFKIFFFIFMKDTFEYCH
jgi:hypothetical protein